MMKKHVYVRIARLDRTNQSIASYVSNEIEMYLVAYNNVDRPIIITFGF